MQPSNECVDQWPEVASRAGEGSATGKQQGRRNLTQFVSPAKQRREVLDILGDDASTMLDPPAKQLLVGQRTKVVLLNDGSDIVPALTQCRSDHGCVHLVQ